MSLFMRRAAIVPVASLLLLAACQSNASPSASTAASQAASAAASVAASVAPTPVATVPSDQLAFAGKLVICSTSRIRRRSSSTRTATRSARTSRSRRGSRAPWAHVRDRELGLRHDHRGAQGGKCDIIISAQNINADRLKQVDMIPYFQAGQAFVVAKGNPAGIKAERTCVARRSLPRRARPRSTTSAALATTRARASSKRCAAAGKAAIDVTQFARTPTRCWRSRPARSTPTSPTPRSPATTPCSIPTSSSCPASSRRASARRASASRK